MMLLISSLTKWANESGIYIEFAYLSKLHSEAAYSGKQRSLDHGDS
jgi:hypothetical protein